jgi:peptidylprolyl isomerase
MLVLLTAALSLTLASCETKLVNATGRDPVDVADSDYVTTSTGLKYYDIRAGTGTTAQVGETAVVHYTGWLQNGGLEFDSTRDSNVPFRFVVGVGEVIDGWEEGVATMKVGGVRQLVVPATLAYGTQSRGPIPPNSILIFEVELVALE